MKRVSMLASLFVLAVSLAVAIPGSASATSSWCSDGAPAPCVESATVNGSAVASGDPTWDVTASLNTAGGSNDVDWQVLSKSTGFTLGSGSLTDVWVITLDMGTTIPRVAWSHGTAFSVVRTDDGDGTYHATITATPVVTVGDCDQSSWPWTCPSTASTEWDGYLDGAVTDYNAWTDVTQRQSMYGMDYAFNIAATSIPPELISDPTTGYDQILIRLANPHFEMDGSTVFQGSFHLVIPKSFLQVVYGIDDPATLTGTGILPSLSGTGGGTVTVSLDPSNNVVVDGSNITFSSRTLKLRRGVITPTKPTKVFAHRVSPLKGKLTFAPAKPHGSRITGYRAVCVNGSTTKVGTAKASPVYVTNLAPGKAYTCRVRAKSKAGFGAWSAKVHLAG
jgi:fibronectin type III domain protein